MLDNFISRRFLLPYFWVTALCTLTFGIIFVSNPSWETIYKSFLISSLYYISCFLTQALLDKYLNKKWNWITETRKRLVYGVSITVFVNIVVVFLCSVINFSIIQNVPFSRLFSKGFLITNLFSINLSFLISAIFYAHGFMIAWKKESQKVVKEQKIMASSVNAQFETLKSQLDPHFLFNSLNVLNGLIEENPTQAQKFTSEMSRIYRYILNQQSKQLISLEEEINFARMYIDLLKYRFEDSIMLKININSSNIKSLVAPLSLQLLLENCIKHNLATPSKPLHIKIYIENENLVVQNNTQKRFLPNEKHGIGLANIIKRYELLTNKKVIVEEKENTFTVQIPLIYEEKEQKN